MQAAMQIKKVDSNGINCIDLVCQLQVVTYPPTKYLYLKCQRGEKERFRYFISPPPQTPIHSFPTRPHASNPRQTKPHTSRVLTRIRDTQTDGRFIHFCKGMRILIYIKRSIIGLTLGRLLCSISHSQRNKNKISDVIVCTAIPVFKMFIFNKLLYIPGMPL